MKFDEMFPSKYLRGADLEKPLAVRIKSVSIELLGKEQEAKPVCYFVGDVKPMILNKTNCATLITITGTEESDEWGGHRVELYRETIMMNGSRTPALRIRALRKGDEPEDDDVPDTWGDEPMTSSVKKRA
jgi:hypothetical protein